MIWVRILRVGSVRGRRKRGLANTVPTLRRDRVGGAEEDELVGATVRRRERVRGDGMRAPIAGRDLDRLLGDGGPVALVVNAYPDVENPAADAVGGEAAGCRDRDLRAAAAIAAGPGVAAGGGGGAGLSARAGGGGRARAGGGGGPLAVVPSSTRS